MHWNSYYMMGQFAEKHLNKDQVLNILDVGSMEVVDSGTYRPIFDVPAWTYTGCDMAAGDNVDVVINSPYHLPFAKNTFDVVITGQVFEHVEFFWELATEIARVVKPGGYLCIIVPSTGQVHRFPVDCWRFYEDGMKAIAKWIGFDVLEARVDENSCWKDAILIAKKP